MTHAAPPRTDAGSDRLLHGMILGVLAFWLFAQTTLNIAPTMAADLGVPMNVMNIAVSITALFSGIFIVVMGGLADRGTTARREPLVDGVVGRLRLCRVVRRADGTECRVALDLLRRRRGLRGRHADGARHTRKPRRGQGVAISAAIVAIVVTIPTRHATDGAHRTLAR